MVAPHGGAWIEIIQTHCITFSMWQVAPHGGAWIEILSNNPKQGLGALSLPRGSVD